MGLSNKIIKTVSIVLAAVLIIIQLQPAVAVATTCYNANQVEHLGQSQATSTSCSSTAPTTVSGSGGTIPTSSSSSNTGSSQTGPPTCQASLDPLTWLVCPIINMIVNAEYTLEKVVEQLLQTQPLYFSSTANCTASTSTQTCNQMKYSAALFSVWSTFRVYGNIVLVIALLVIVIGEAAGGGVFEAYNLRKVLPRILVAAILINLSIYIVAALEDIANILGASMQTLIETPFRTAAGSFLSCASSTGLCIQPNAGSGAIFSLGLAALVGVAVSGVGIGVLLMLVGSALIAALGVLVTLMLREGILVFLLIASPIAFALYVMPNTEKYFKQWWTQLIKTLLVYPVVTVVFGMAYVTAIIMGDFGLTPVTLSQTFSTLAMIAPLFLIPFAFRISGGVMANVSGMVSKLQSRATKPMMSRARKMYGQTYQRRKSGQLFRGGTDANFRGRLNRGLQKTLNAPSVMGADPTKWKSRIDSVVSNQDFIGAVENAEKNPAFSAIKANDKLLNAGLNYNTEDDMISHGGLTAQEAASVMQAKRSMSAQEFGIAASMALPATGTAFANGAGEMYDTINRVAGNDRALASRMLGSMRQSAMQAGRTDLGGGGFGDMQTALDAVHNGTMTIDQATEATDISAIKAQGVSAFMNTKSNVMPRLSKVLKTNLDTAKAGGNKKEIDNAYADISNAYDQASALSPEKGRQFADEVMGQTVIDPETSERLRRESGIIGPVPVGPVSIRQAVDTRRSNAVDHPDYHDRRREQQQVGPNRPGGIDPMTTNTGTGGP